MNTIPVGTQHKPLLVDFEIDCKLAKPKHLPRLRAFKLRALEYQEKFKEELGSLKEIRCKKLRSTVEKVCGTSKKKKDGQETWWSPEMENLTIAKKNSGVAIRHSKTGIATLQRGGAPRQLREKQ